MDKNDVFKRLKGMGIAKIEVEFSGGNDEGGVDGFAIFDSDGALMPDDTLPKSVWPQTVQHWTSPQNGEVHKGHQKDAEGNHFDDGARVVRCEGADWNGPYRLATADEIDVAEFHGAISAPIYERYGGFAGEFYVSGCLVWDVEQLSCHMKGQEEVSHYESFDYDY